MIELEDALAFLPADREPPANLEEKIVAMLRQQGEIRSQEPQATVSAHSATKGNERSLNMEVAKSHSGFSLGRAVFVGIAATAIAFFGGLRAGAPPKAAKDSLPRFALLLYEGKNFDHGR